MFHRYVFVFLLLVIQMPSLRGQHSDSLAEVTGRLWYIHSDAAPEELPVYISRLGMMTVSGPGGKFYFSRVPFGVHEVVAGIFPDLDTFRLSVDLPELDAGMFFLRRAHEDGRGDAGFSEIAAGDGGGSEEEDATAHFISGMLRASRDPFINTVQFTFSPYRFQARGYPGSRQQVRINGVPVQDLRNGVTAWGHWSGLNDVFRMRAQSYGLEPSEHDSGSPGGVVAIETVAADMQEQARFTGSLSNRQYRQRMMFTHTTGLRPHGWATAFSFSVRRSEQGYVQGTFYNAIAGYWSISRVIGIHRVSLTAFGNYSYRGKQMPATAEAYELAGSPRYNPAWGYYMGEVRNSRTAREFVPVIQVVYRCTPGKDLVLNTAVSHRRGFARHSAIDWFRARDPRPDYYRYMPSWQLQEGDTATAARIRNNWMQHPDQFAQVDWERMVEVNRSNTETVSGVNGIAGDQVTGRRSAYVLADDVTGMRNTAVSMNMRYNLHAKAVLRGGVDMVLQHTFHYRELTDLLGGDFFLNLNQFSGHEDASGFLMQYDLRNPGRLVREGEIYNYHYAIHARSYTGWMQGLFTGKRMEAFLGFRAVSGRFWREGYFQNGLFPASSYGPGSRVKSMVYGLNAGLTWKLSGRQFLFFRWGNGSDPIRPDHTYVSVRVRDQLVPSVRSAAFRAAEAGYVLSAPRFRASVSGYATDLGNVTAVHRFYNDDPAFRSFVNYVMQGAGIRYTGMELASEVRFSSGLSITAVAALGQTFYTRDPEVTIYRDDDTALKPFSQQAYLSNHYAATGPQTAYSLRAGYRAPAYWFVNLSFNYLDRNYISVHPGRRTEAAAGMLDREGELIKSVFGQQRLPGFFTADIFLGKSVLLSRIVKRLPSGTYLYCQLGINNLLHHTRIITGGFEQMRFDFSERDPLRFPPKYFYAPGASFFLNLSLKF